MGSFEESLAWVKRRAMAGQARQVVLFNGESRVTPPPKVLSNEAADRGQKPTIARTKKDIALLAAAHCIQAKPTEGNDLAFMHSVLCQVGLPRSKVDGHEFTRRQGAAWICVQAGYLDEGDGQVLQPVPYGPMPRLALAWVSTYALRHNTREVPIGDSASDFLRQLGKTTSGGARGGYSSLRTQIHALAACRLQLGYKGRTYNGQAVEQFDAWLTGKASGQRALWPGLMVLSEGYFQELKAHGVPLDNRALMALKGSALALDVYTWLAHRLHRLDARGQWLSWNQLFGQFGQEFTGMRPLNDFQKVFKAALRDALAVYPAAHVKLNASGLQMLPSPPPVGKSVE